MSSPNEDTVSIPICEDEWGCAPDCEYRERKNAQFGWCETHEMALESSGQCVACLEDANAAADWYVNVYEVRRLFGGPEEGGWYYNAGVPLASILVDSEEEARSFLPVVLRTYEDRAWGDVYSVRGGVAIEVHVERQFAEPWPRQPPRYE